LKGFSYPSPTHHSSSNQHFGIFSEKKNEEIADREKKELVMTWREKHANLCWVVLSWQRVMKWNLKYSRR
jgi:hypothetical protein